MAIRSLRTFHLPSAGALPVDVTAGRGGQIWFTEFAADKIGRIRPDGHIDEFRVPTPGAGPYQLAALPDGRVFFTEFNTNKIGRVDQAGAVSELSLGGGSTRRPWDHDRGRQRVDR
ncbi:MAG: hypothetical protein JO240_02645 [Solirubrobacterales bacterium]|nr:hypothetical protein [Solirubrobacterales bacterium]